MKYQNGLTKRNRVVSASEAMHLQEEKVSGLNSLLNGTESSDHEIKGVFRPSFSFLRVVSLSRSWPCRC